jgi:hypothetical protein
MGDISWRITAPCPVNPVFLTGNPVGIPRAVIPVVLLIHPLRPSSAFHMAWLALLPASSVRAGTRSGVRVSVVEGVRLLRPGGVCLYYVFRACGAMSMLCGGVPGGLSRSGDRLGLAGGRPECRDHGRAGDHGGSGGRSRARTAGIKDQFMIMEPYAGDRPASPRAGVSGLYPSPGA